MNVKIRILPILLIGIAFQFSCKKSSPTATNYDKLKLYIEDDRNTPLNAIDSFSVTYDGNNRLTGLLSNLVSVKYTYTSTQSYTLDLYASGVLSIHEIFFINNSMLVNTTIQWDNSGDTTTESYRYIGKLLTRKSTYNYTQATDPQTYMQEDYTYDKNENLLTDSLTDGYGNINSISTYTYTNKSFINLVGAIYLPVQAKVVPATQVQKDGFGNLLASSTYSYVFDSMGRVIKETDAANNGQSVVKSYVF